MSTIYCEIEANRSSILKAWRMSFDGEVGGGCPSSASRGNRFTNSVSHLVSKGTDDVISWLLGGEDVDSIPGTLVDLCRLKAVQEAGPSLALNFIFDLKRIIHRMLGGSVRNADMSNELSVVDERIDNLMLFAFDRYSESREQIYLIRIAEMQRSESLMQRRMVGLQNDRERELV